MSWSGNTAIPAGTPAEEVRNVIGQIVISGQDIVEAKAAADAALDAAATLIVSGAVGNLENSGFTVVINGHANPGFEAPEGWGKDFVGVHVYRKPLGE